MSVIRGRWPTALFASLLLVPAVAVAQPSPADYDRAHGLRDAWEFLTADVADPATWDANDRFHYRKTVLGGHRFVAFDLATGQKRPAFDHERLASALSRATGETHTAIRLPFSEFELTDGGRALAFSVDREPWRCTLGDYACSPVPVEARRQSRPRSFGAVRDLEAEFDDSPRRSPDGRWEAFIQNYNIAVRPVGGDGYTLLSRDGSDGDFYDIESITWSPDSEKLIAYRVKPGFRREINYITAAPDDQLQAKHFTLLYAKPGDRIDLEQPVLFHVEERRQIEVPNGLFPNPFSLQNLEWLPDSRAVRFEYNQRGHQLYRVIEVDAATGAPRALVTEESATFINARRASDRLNGGGSVFRHDLLDSDEIIWMSERDGWKHLYLYDAATGEVKNQITRGEWIVSDVVHVDEDERQIWFLGRGMNDDQDPYFAHYYRIDFDGSNLTPLTHHAAAYHEVRFSPDMEHYVDVYSRVDMPNVAELRRTRDGSLVRELERGDISQLTAAGFRTPEVFTAKGRDGESDIWGVIVRPTNFDPSQSYPVVENIYAGPHGSFVPKTFWPFGAHSSGDKVSGMQQQAELGFVVVMIDGMGTSNRSKRFHDYAWKDVGDAGFPDRVLWHEAVAARYPWYDADRVGIYGGSAGGQNAMGALLFHPDFYDAAVAYNGCHDNRMDKISWNESWMGWPIDESYAASSNVDNAHLLEGNLLLVLGDHDSNVDPASTMQVVDALIDAGKMFDLLVIPGGEHGAGRTVGPVTYGERIRWDFFVRHLRGEQPPNWNRIANSRTAQGARGGS